jgi:hypothetical protein
MDSPRASRSTIAATFRKAPAKTSSSWLMGLLIHLVVFFSTARHYP